MISSSLHRKRRANKYAPVSAISVATYDACGIETRVSVPAGASMKTCRQAAGQDIFFVDDLAEHRARIVGAEHCHFMAPDCARVRDALHRAARFSGAVFDETVETVGVDAHGKPVCKRVARIRSGADELMAYLREHGSFHLFEIVSTRASHVSRASGSGPVK